MFKNYTFNLNNVSEVVYSIVIPVYNQENIIVKNLKSIINNTLENFEIIIILDFCFDNTENNLIKYLDNYNKCYIYFYIFLNI